MATIEASLRAAAEEQAEALPAAQRRQFVKDYVEVLTDINKKIDRRLEQFIQEVVPLIHLYNPHSPGAAAAQATQLASFVRAVGNMALDGTAAVSNQAVRTVTAGTIQDVVGVCAAGLAELAVRHDRRLKKQVS